MVLLLLAACATAIAQDRYWTGGSGNWSDPAKWSDTPGGAGGAGVPRVGENVHFATTSSITIDDVAWCRDLSIDGSHGTVTINGGSELNIAGSWRMNGEVLWGHSGPVKLISRHGADLDLRGIPINTSITFNGNGSWSLASDMQVEGDLILINGSLIGNANVLKAHAIEFNGDSRFIGNDGALMLQQIPSLSNAIDLIQPGNSTLVVNGDVVPWGIPAPAGGQQRDVNVCGTGPGQTPFVIDAQLISDYNGYGVSCRGVCDGSVTVSVSGGVGPFTYQWLNSGPPSATWNSACGGPQIVIVTDLGQGISCPVSVNVSEPGPLGVIFFGQGTPPTCADVCDGSRTALAVGGVSPHMYDWNNGAGNSSAFFELCAGLNTLLITDANNCSFDTTFFFNIQPIDPALTFTPVSCFGECDGTAEVTPSGGTGALSVTWSPEPPIGQNTTMAGGLCAGDWSVTIADANGCDTTMVFTIDGPPPIEPMVTSVDASCSGSCDGTASVVLAGVGPYTFSWSPEPGGGQGTADATGLCEGDHSVTITDQTSGCDSTITISISAPGPIDLQPQVTDALCANSCDGSILLQPVGGTPPLGFLWSPAPPIGQGTSTISGLCPGEWQVTVTDAEGCDTTMIFTVGAPPPLVPDLSVIDIACNGSCDGSASVIVTGGVEPYTFLWSPAPPIGQGTDSISGLCAGDHDLTITDANGCDTTITFTIIEPPPLDVVPASTAVTCAGACDGTAGVSVSGGTPGYTYVWTPEPPVGQGTADVSGLCAGPWEVSITDASGCTIVEEFVIDDALPLDISIDITQATCPGECDGAAIATVSGGTSPYTYAWSPAPGSGQGSASVAGLCPGEWSLTVTDALGCDSTIIFTVDQPDPIAVDATVNDATCATDCDGSIALIVSGGSGAFTYAWSPVPPIGQGTANVSGLCPGDWEVTIGSGPCDTVIVFTIAAPDPIGVTTDITDATCSGDCDGAADLVVSGGTAPYTFVWSPAPPIGQGTANVSGLCAGPYSVSITDAAGCDTTLAITIAEPLPITADLQISPAGCGGACDGGASIVVSGGTAPYTYQWGPGTINGQGSDTVTDLCPGAYDVIVTDAAGCTETFSFTIEAPAGITVDATITDASCADACDGSIEVEISGGEAPYTIAWSPEPGAGQGTDSITGLCAGEWTLLVTDALGCDTTIAYQIAAPDAIVPNEAWTNESCNGPCDGTASVAPTGGTPPFNFSWSPAPPVGQGTSDASGLCPGIWEVTITDAAGCDTIVAIEILDQLPITADLAITEPLCAGECTASVTATPVGGVEPYTFNWSPAPPIGQGTATAENLCAGTWQVEVIDALGCDTIIAFDINEPTSFSIDLSTTNETCDAPCTGTATLSINGGTGIPTILWQPEPGSGQGTAAAGGLCSGIAYSVSISDENGCDTTLNFTIEPFEGILIDITSTMSTCSGGCDGSASVVAQGGMPPYTYNWSPAPVVGQGTAQAQGLCEGDVILTITDAAGCVIDTTITITAPDPLADNAIVTDSPCASPCTGIIEVSPTGGTGPYDVYWSPVPQEGQGSLIATGLCMGTYLVQIVDANGCEQIFSHEVFKPDPLDVSIDATPSECQQCIGAASATVTGGTSPYSYVWTDQLGDTISLADTAAAMCAGLYQLEVIDANGCPIITAVPIVDPSAETITAIDGAVSCPGNCDGTAAIDLVCSDPPCTIAWSDGAGNDLGISDPSVDMLCEGSYFATVTNAAGCVAIEQVEVIAPDPIDASAIVIAASCFGACDASASIAVAGGVPPFTFIWDPAPAMGQGTPIASGLCAGTYAVAITDGNGCSDTLSIDVPDQQPLMVDPLIVHASCADACDGSISPGVTGGVAPYIFMWSPALPTAADGSVTGLCSGTYDLTVIDANGCSFTQGFTINGPAELELTASTTASTCPDCDGTASVSINGGTAPFTIEWNLQGTVIGNTDTVIDLCGGLYVVNVIDTNGCTASATVIVNDSNAEVLTTIDGVVSCADDCDGTVEVQFTCSDPPCTAMWMDDQGNVIANDVLQATDLCVGEYVVQVTNASGCTSLATATVSPSQVIVPNVSATTVGCAGACDATAMANPTGGIPPYTFVWSPEPGGGQNTNTATGLCVGDHSVTITDASGCDTTITVTITDPAPIMFAALVSDPLCGNDCDGSIDVLVSGGFAPYTFNWSPEPPAGQGTATNTDLCAGEYTLIVTDNAGCSHTESWIIDAPEPLELTGNTISSECGVCSGGAEVIASGGVPPYTYSWSSSGNFFGSDPVLSGLCAGLYVVTVIDANGCTESIAIPVSDADGETLSTSVDPVSCPGDCDGSASVSFNCSLPDCTILWTGALGDTLTTDVNAITDLCEGIYFVLVTNSGGCVSIEQIDVTAPDPIEAEIVATMVSCAGACDGSATVNATGGTGPLTFNWQPAPGAGQGTAQATAMCAGNYEVTITDSTGCSIVVPVVITEPDTVSATIDVTPISCNAACDGVIDIVPAGGTPPYDIVWSPVPPGGQGIFTATDLCAGVWSITITDPAGCSDQQQITLDEPDVLDVQLNTINNGCAGACDGEASISISGGTPPFAITWTDDLGNIIDQDVVQLTGLCGGSYEVTVTDQAGCEVIQQFTIQDALPLVVDLTVNNETCNGPCDGTASVVISGGSGGSYSILWQPEPGAGQGTAQAMGLCAGTWSVTITDQSSCDTTITFDVLPYELIVVDATVQDVSCNGDCDGSIGILPSGGNAPFTYVWSPEPPIGQGTDSVSGLCAGDHSVLITDASGCDTTFTFTIGSPTAIDIQVDSVVEASCNTATDGSIAITINGGSPGYTTEWTGPDGFSSMEEDPIGLLPGIYDLTVTDAQGCTNTLQVEVGALMPVEADAGIDQEICPGNLAELNGSFSIGGTSFQWTDANGDPIADSVIAIVGPLPPGVHIFTLTVSDGNCFDSDEVAVVVLDPPVADAGEDQSIFNSGTATLGGSPTGPDGSGFVWWPDSVLSDPTVPNPIADPSITTWFTVTVIAPNGCESIDSVLVTVLPDLVIPNGFTPNGDGWNETWQIDLIELFPECVVEIYNRWGEQLFRSVGYKQPWDGRYNGGPVPVGTYYYVIELNSPEFPEPYTGPLTVIR